MKFLLGFVLMFAVVACGEKDPDVKKPAGTPTPTQKPNESLQLNDSSAVDFYNGFLYSESAPLPQKYRYIKSSREPIGEKPANATKDKEICADFSLSLKSDKTYVLDYRESYCIVSAARPETQTPTFVSIRPFTGQWRVNKLDLVLDNLLVGRGAKLNGVDVIGFHFMTNIHTADLQKPLFVGSKFSSSTGMSGG